MTYSGKTGYIKVGEKLIAHMSGFSLEMSTDILEAVSYGNEYKEKMTSIKDWSSSANGYVDFATDSGQEDLFTAFENGNLITVGLGLDDDLYFEGTAYIESLSIDSASDDIVTLDIELAGSNAVVLHNTISV